MRLYRSLHAHCEKRILCLRRSVACLAGDFNACPGSPIYRFASTGSLDLDLVNRRHLAGHKSGKGFRDFSKSRHKRHSQTGQASADSTPRVSFDHTASTSEGPSSRADADRSTPVGRPRRSTEALRNSMQASRSSMEASRHSLLDPTPVAEIHHSSHGPAAPKAEERVSSVAVKVQAGTLAASAQSSEYLQYGKADGAGGSGGLLGRVAGILTRTLGSAVVGLFPGSGPATDGGRTLSAGRRKRWSARELQRALGSRLGGEAESGDACTVEPAGPNVAHHPLKLQSAYLAVCGHEPEYTSSHSQFMDTCDYLWTLVSPGAAQAAAAGGAVTTPGLTRSPSETAAAAGAASGCATAGAHGQPEAAAPGSAAPGDSEPWTLTPYAVLLPPNGTALSQGLPALSLPSDHISLVVDLSLTRGA